MQASLDPKEMVGRKITLFHFNQYQLVIGVEGGGYINIESHCDWDDHSIIVEGEDLNEKQQAELGLMSPEEYAEYLRIQEEKAAKLAEERRMSAEASAAVEKENKAAEIWKLAELMRKYPDVAKEFANPTAGFTRYGDGKVRPATVEEIAVMVSGELPPERQRFPREVR